MKKCKCNDVMKKSQRCSSRIVTILQHWKFETTKKLKLENVHLFFSNQTQKTQTLHCKTTKSKRQRQERERERTKRG